MLPVSQLAAAAPSDLGLAMYSAVPLRAFDPSVALDAPASVRALAAFLASTAFGGAVIYGYGDRLGTAVDASTSSLPLSALYGLLAYGLVGFLVAYGYAQLSRVGVGTPAITAVGGLALVGGLFALGGLGYVVVGTWVADSVGARDPWIGLLGVGLVGAVAVLVLPLLAGVVAWFAIGAVGVGGPVRRWVHADAAERRVENG